MRNTSVRGPRNMVLPISSCWRACVWEQRRRIGDLCRQGVTFKDVDVVKSGDLLPEDVEQVALLKYRKEKNGKCNQQ